MALQQTAAASIETGVATLGTLPLQFSGDFLYWAIIFLVLAVVAGLLGARGVAGLSMTVAKWLVIIFVILAVISLLL